MDLYSTRWLINNILLHGGSAINVKNPQSGRWSMDIAVFMLKIVLEVDQGNHTQEGKWLFHFLTTFPHSV